MDHSALIAASGAGRRSGAKPLSAWTCRPHADGPARATVLQPGGSMPPQDYDPDPPVDTAPAKPWHWVLMVVATLWFSAAATGLWVLWGYENQPGRGADSRAQWPSDSGLAHATDRPTLVMLVHPQCVCSRASLTELAEILARAGTVPRTYVLFLKPRGVADGWERTDTWRAAAALPGADVVLDDEGATAARFGG